MVQTTHPGATTEIIPIFAVRDGGELIPILLYEESEHLHTATRPFCEEQTCMCHKDPMLLAEARLYSKMHSLTPEQAIRYINGQMIEEVLPWHQ